MNKILVKTDVLVIRKEPSNSDSMQRIECFSGNEGFLLAFKRESKKQGKGVSADLFDWASVELESPAGSQSHFVKDYQLIERYSAIGKNYRALQCASQWATLLRKNLKHLEHWQPVFELSHKGFRAWDEGKCPDTVLLKLLFVLARDEGYPIEAEWMEALSETEKDELKKTINHAAPLSSASEKGSKDRVKDLLEKLLKWFEYRTDILLS